MVSKMSIKEHRLREILSHVAARYNMKNWCYEKEQQSETIENYIGILIPFTVFRISGDKEFFQHVYVKLPSLEESVRGFSAYLWDTEAYVYDKLVPEWKRLSKVNVNELIPQCYFADATLDNQALVLKDMRYEGFQKYVGTFLDFEHVVVSLKSLAQFHALSIIIKKEHGKLDSSVLKPYTALYPLKLNEALQNSFRRHSPLFKGSKFEQFWEVTLANYKTVVNEDTLKAKCLVYGHGDYWKENLMYKYEDGSPVKACIFDFQTCRVMSPAHDFLFFILNSTRGNLRRLHYHNFVSEYYDALQNNLFDYNIELSQFYNKDDFISDLKLVAPFCMIRICMAFSLWLGFESDTLVKSKNSFENKHQRDRNLHFLKELFCDAMEDLFKYEYISL